ncbi:MAG: hypothetical protein KME17_26735 [Cyanosarcina radialis HA8281-LM2]|nr:hypothetical protein [Cyanosarcina radialis HA8281-LM2]
MSICISSGKAQNELKKFYLEKNNQIFTLLYFTLILEAIAKFGAKSTDGNPS